MQDVGSMYRSFAANEAAGRSDQYERLSLAVAGSTKAQHFLEALPPQKRQPNLLFAALRFLGIAPSTGGELEDSLAQHGDAIRACMELRSTQTNEPGRCAVMVPILAQLPQPLALLEVGASAGLCLFPDHYAYTYGSRRLDPSRGPGGEPPVYACHVEQGVPVPTQLPEVVWRAGIDLNPIDLEDPAEAAWLKALVWPDQPERIANLERAIACTAGHPRRLVEGDLVDRLDSLANEAPADATLVVFHTAVLCYVSPAHRQRFVERVAALDATWISNEAAGVLPELATGLSAARTARHFVLAVDGRAVGIAGPHGQSLDWVHP